MIGHLNESLNGKFYRSEIKGIKISKIYLGLDFFRSEKEDIRKRKILFLKVCEEVGIKVLLTERNRDGFGIKADKMLSKDEINNLTT